MAFEDAEQETVEYIGSAAAESEVALEEAVATLARQDKLSVRSPAHRDLLITKAFFRLVQKGFVDAGYPLNAALVSLDWAALLLQHGDTAAAGELACEMLPIFEALEIEREVLMSLRLLTESLRRQAASVADVKDAARELGLARRVRKPAG